jgi:anthranilate phosphoribosyltransferase
MLRARSHVDIVRELPALIKHVGRGPRLAKDLPRDEAREVMRAILAGEADPVQTGGFLMAMRMKSESADELAGFVEAMRAAAAPVDWPAHDPAHPLVDVDLHGDGRAGRPSITLAAACLVAAATGARVLVRGSFGGRFARHDLDDVYAALGVDVHLPPARAARALRECGVGVLDLGAWLPDAAALLGLRERLGVRTCVNTAVKLLDPAGARRVAIGIFHGPYHAPVAGAARALAVVRAAVVQAPGGVPELAPDKPTRVSLVDEAAAAPAEPFVFEGQAGLAPPAVESAADLAALLEHILVAPDDAPPGAVRMTLTTAALHAWLAGLAPSPQDSATLTRLHDALRSGRAAATLRALRGCCTA